MENKSDLQHCHICKAGVEKFEVMYDGTVVPCAGFKGRKDLFALGNILKGDSLEDCLERGRRHPLLNALKYLCGQPVPVDYIDFSDVDFENLKKILKGKFYDNNP